MAAAIGTLLAVSVGFSGTSTAMAVDEYATCESMLTEPGQYCKYEQLWPDHELQQSDYGYGEPLNTTGLVVRLQWARYNSDGKYSGNGSTRLSANDYTITGYDSTSYGKQTLTLVYKRNTSVIGHLWVTVNHAAISVYRVFNPNSGEHFYTTSRHEADHLVSLGWGEEGGLCTMDRLNGTPIYRLYNPNSGWHMYITSQTERDHLVRVGWNYEGVAFYSPNDATIPVWRLYNPRNGDHLFTAFTLERDTAMRSGWTNEGIAFMGR